MLCGADSEGYLVPWKPEMQPPRLEPWVPLSNEFWLISNRKRPIFLRTTTVNGQSIVFDMKDTSQIPAVAEPWFLAFNAKVSFRPIMTRRIWPRSFPRLPRPLRSTESRSSPGRHVDSEMSGKDWCGA
jgi:hypothetical protein